MHTTNCKKFKGESENYVLKGQNNFELKIDRALSTLWFKTLLSRTNIKKADGYHTAHLLFILILLPILKIKTVHGFCQKHWYHRAVSKKDTFYQFKQAVYRWRSFMFKVITEISSMLMFERYPREEQYLVIDDTVIAKRGEEHRKRFFHFRPQFWALCIGILCCNARTFHRTRLLSC